jgi:hypothetical protein
MSLWKDDRIASGSEPPTAILFKELLRLRKDDRTGAVPMDVLHRLRIPMPEDVLEQFLGDHGINHDFQRQYGELDLHTIRWNLVATPATEIIACSAYADFQEYVDDCRGKTLNVPNTGWQEVCLGEAAKKHWQVHRTWRRPPVFIRGELVGSSQQLHLVEGHTRTGALTGLVESGWLPGDSLHEIWLATLAETPEVDTTWQQVLREERMPFVDWLIHRVPNNGPLGKVGDSLLSAKCNGELAGDDLVAVLGFVAKDPAHPKCEKLVRDEYKNWERETMK